MTNVDKALQTQLGNIEKKTSKSIDELIVLVASLGDLKHKQKVDLVKERLSLGYGDANTLVHYSKQVNDKNDDSASNLESNPLDILYVGKKEALRPIHEQLLLSMNSFGDFETAPKKSYISYRVKKQFCMIGPATNSRVDLGLNIKTLPSDEKLIEQPKGKMCNYIVKLESTNDITDTLIDYIKEAYLTAL